MSIPDKDYNMCFNMWLSSEDIVHLDIKELNKILKDERIPASDQSDIKKMRRREKMKKYRKECRERKSMEYSQLVDEREKLYDEWTDLIEEVEMLRKNKAVLEILSVCDSMDYY